MMKDPNSSDEIRTLAKSVWSQNTHVLDEPEMAEFIDRLCELFTQRLAEEIRAAREAEHNWIFSKFGDVDDLPLREWEMIHHEANARLKSLQPDSSEARKE